MLAGCRPSSPSKMLTVFFLPPFLEPSDDVCIVISFSLMRLAVTCSCLLFFFSSRRLVSSVSIRASVLRR